MNFSRRFFLKSAAMAFVATQLPRVAELGHRVLFIDGAPYFVQDYTEKDGIIRAKVVNGLWDMVLDTHRKTMQCWSNPSYGYDADQTIECKTTRSYHRLIEIRVSESIGEVTEEMKPREVMIPKYEEVEEIKWENGNPVLSAGPGSAPVMEKVFKPVMVQRTESWGEDVFDENGDPCGIMTMTWWEQDTYPITVDPLNGAGIDYNAVIAAAEEKRATQSWWA